MPPLSRKSSKYILRWNKSLKFCIFEKKHEMTKLEIKNNLIKRIREIDDLQFLEAIRTIIDSKSEKTILLTDEQKNEILLSQKEVSEGLFIEQKQLDQEINKWLSGK